MGPRKVLQRVTRSPVPTKRAQASNYAVQNKCSKKIATPECSLAVTNSDKYLTKGNKWVRGESVADINP